MKVIQPYYIIETPIIRDEILQLIEKVGRTCYKSESKITSDSASKFIRNIIKSGHEAIIEHFNITVRFICDRGVSHEIVRHRMASYAQESTRYCNYSKDKFNNELTVIEPSFFIDDEYDKLYQTWYKSMLEAEKGYFKLLELGAKPQEARSVLPNSLKTEIVMTANLREWRHFFKLRCDKSAHPQIREIAIPLLKELQINLPEVFDDIIVEGSI